MNTSLLHGEEPSGRDGLPFLNMLMLKSGCALQAANLAAQTDTVHFANWEAHTRGIGSKLMLGMGFRQNQGLGRTLTGSQAPLEVCPWVYSSNSKVPVTAACRTVPTLYLQNTS